MSVKDRGNIFKEVWRLSSQASIGTNESCLLSSTCCFWHWASSYWISTGFIPNIAQVLDGLQCVVCSGLSEILVLFQSVAQCAALWRLKERREFLSLYWNKVLWGSAVRKKKGHLFFPPCTCLKSEEGSLMACSATLGLWGLRHTGPCLSGAFVFRKNTGGVKVHTSAYSMQGLGHPRAKATPSTLCLWVKS